jgi:hypothetical protein
MIHKSIWQGQKAMVVTMHGKNEVIQSEFASLGLKWTNCELNTDQFGTFSGEIKRNFDAISTARQKCDLAFCHTDVDIAIASEGSFGPHPNIPFIPVNEELLLFKERKTGFESFVFSRVHKTNFTSLEVSSLHALEKAANNACFPSHALIVTDVKRQEMVKGIVDWKILEKTFNRFKEKHENIILETDMRAMLNPTRMEHIRQAAKKLYKKLDSCCPECQSPGFGNEHYESGLPCSACGLPTSSVLKLEIACPSCEYVSHVYHPNGKTDEDPQYCSFCNP